MNRSRAYIDLYKRGPFAGMIDPWAEVGRYFHQIHAGMIGALLIQLQDDLIGRGYQAGRETSLQVMEHTQPDLFIHRPGNRQQPRNWDYPAAAQAVLMEPGEALSVPTGTGTGRPVHQADGWDTGDRRRSHFTEQ